MHYMYNQINTYILCIIISYTLLLHPHNHPTIEATTQNLETPIQIHNNYERSISVNCFEKRIETLPITIIPLFNQIVNPGQRIHIDFGRNLFEEMLFCTFTANRRKWNCGEELIIAEQCVWENPLSIMMRAGVPTEDECPQCDIRNSVGEIACQWGVLQEGLYLNQYDPNLHFANYLRRRSWVDHDPFRLNLAASEQFYQFSVRNDLNEEVTITCGDKLERPEYLRARRRRDGGPAVWEKRLNMLDDLNGGGGTWVCDFLVEATGMYCNGIRIWTPVGVVHPSEQDPPCIDCAWKLTDRYILLDMRDCGYDWPIWEPVHEWGFFDDDMSE